jgi:outer membrane protein OmpA-like peptidoglycan-associated protein
MKIATQKSQKTEGAPTLTMRNTGLLQRKCACGGKVGLTGQCAQCQSNDLLGDRPPLIQTKLRVNAPGDKYEQEADRVAEQVMLMPDPKLQQQTESKNQTVLQKKPSVQRQTDEEDEEVLQTKPMVQRQTEENDEEEVLQAKPLVQRRVCGGASGNTQAPPIVNQVLQSPGRPLDTATRSFMEPRFGHDFSQVRIHADAKAAESARAVNAQAYTVGHNVVFGHGQYSPGNSTGRSLLAHELVHVGQQNGGFDVRQKRALPSIATVQRQAAIPEGRPPLSSPKLARLLGHTDLSGFRHNRSELRKAHREELTAYSRTILNLLRDYPTGVLTITGHSDASGGPERNDPLGLARAEAAKAFLVTAGVDAERINTSTRGENDLRVQTQRKEPRNRRVEIRFIPTPISLGMRGLKKVRTGPKIPVLPPDKVRIGPKIPNPVIPPEPPLIKQPLPCPFLDPDTEKRPTVKLSYGFPLTLEIIVNPQAPVPTEAKLNELFTKSGLRLTHTELKALLEGRSKGVDQLKTIIHNMAPSLGPGCARALAEKIADGLIGKSLGEQLGREHPGSEERLAEQDDRMRKQTGAPDRGLDIQGGVKLIIHF